MSAKKRPLIKKKLASGNCRDEREKPGGAMPEGGVS